MRAGKQRVLVVDDDQLSQQIIGLQLQSCGYEVSTCSSGEEAVALLSSCEEQERPQILVIDLHMPGLAGRELAKQLRRDAGSELRLLAMSATRPEVDAIDCFDGFLLKPIDMALFQEYIANLRVAGDSPRESRDAIVFDFQAEVLDPAVLEKLHRMMSAGAVREVLAACIRDTHLRVAGMRAAWKAGNNQQVRSDAHAIKGSAGMIGARNLAAVCEKLETGHYQGLEIGWLLISLLEEAEKLEGILLGQRPKH